MQAPLSHTASGEQFLSALPSTSPASSPPPFGWRISGPISPVNLKTEAPLLAPLHENSVAEGIGLAHDAGNLLGAIRLYCDLLALPGVLRTEHRHYADELRQLSARSGTLIGRFLGAPPAPDGPVVRERAQRGAETTRPAEVVSACRGLLHTIVGAGVLVIAIETGAEAAIAVPREAMERILVNLTKNAVEAGGEGGCGAITLRVRSVVDPSADGGIALSVEDRGWGMSEAKVRSLLNGETPGGMPEERTGLPGPSGARPGRGIGLRVVRELVAETGGDLRIRSRPGQGTTVEIVWAAVARDETESG